MVASFLRKLLRKDEQDLNNCGLTPEDPKGSVLHAAKVNLIIETREPKAPKHKILYEDKVQEINHKYGSLVRER
jgi:hypothetical protein